MAESAKQNPKKQTKQMSPEKIEKLDELSIDKIDELFEAFSIFDKDYNGTISKKELGLIMESDALNTVEGELINMIEEADTEDNSLIDFPEFVSVLARKSIRIDDDSIDNLFNLFSGSDPNELIDAPTLSSFLYDLGEDYGEGEIEKLISEARLTLNQTPDGRAALSREDFKEMIHSIDINHSKPANIRKSAKKQSKK